MHAESDDDGSSSSRSSNSNNQDQRNQISGTMREESNSPPVGKDTIFTAHDYVRRSDRRRTTITRYEPEIVQPQESDESSESDDSNSESSYEPRRRGRKRKSEAERKREAEEYNNRRRASSLRNVQRKSYYEDDSDDFMDAEDRAVARRMAKAKTEEEEGHVIEHVMDHKGDNEHKQYLIKWKGSAHIHNTWVEASQVVGLKGYKKLQNYMRKAAEYEAYISRLHPEDKEQELVYREMQRTSRESYMRVSRIVSERNDEDGTKYLVLWKNLPYVDCTWEPQQDICKEFQREIDMFIDREDRLKRKPKAWPANKARPFKEMKSQPSWLSPLNLQLRDYQLQGLNWLMYSWSKNVNGILADEMGLGKTIQCVVFMGMLHEAVSLLGPFLVVVPLSTIPAWRHEFAKWTPFLNVITYIGNPQSRETIRDYEFYQKGRKKDYRMNVLITTYDLVMKDKSYLGSVSWKYLMVDEAHRLKDCNSKLYEILNGFKTANRLLITGTPLQNSLKELWCLLHFLDPRKFDNFYDFEDKYGEVDEGGKIGELNKLHEALKPYLLRRVKRDVLKSLPQKTERILRVQQTPMQRRFYRSILAKNYKELNKGDRKQSLMNTVMELKKVCNHPFLLPAAEDEGFRLVDADQKQNNKSYKSARLSALIRNSGKLVLLHKLLQRLKESGNRVLIFSQMVRMLNILAEYLRFCGHRFQRLDGSMASKDRQQAMDHFNKKDSEDFCFLLSTRAGGLGVNLATADTVVIFDSDWNPQNDLQAMARAHRIGQKKHVNIYRFVTKDTVEEKILERAKKKMILDHLVIQQMDTSGQMKIKKAKKSSYSCQDLTKILKFGASNLFKEDRERVEREKNGEKDEKQDIESGEQNPEEDINLDEILQRAETHENPSDQTRADALLSRFNVAEFKTNEMAQEINMPVQDSNIEEQWEQIIPEHLIPEDQKAGNDIQFLMPRKRTQVKRYGEVDYQLSDDPDDTDDKSDDEPISKSANGKPSKRPLSKRDTNQIYKALMRFGNADHALKWLCAGVWKDKKKLDEKAVLSDAELIIKLCHEEVEKSKREKEAASAAGEIKKNPDEPNGSSSKKSKRIFVQYRGSNIDAETLLLRQKEREILDRELEKYKENLKNFRVSTALPPVRWKCKPPWRSMQDSMLLLGVYEHGMGGWDDIIEDKRLGLKRFVVAPDPPTDLSTGKPEGVKTEEEPKTTASPSVHDKHASSEPGGDSKSSAVKTEDSHTSTAKPEDPKGPPKSEDSKGSAKKPVRIVKNSQLKTRVLRLLEFISKPVAKSGKTKKIRPGMKDTGSLSKSESSKSKGSGKRKQASKHSSSIKTSSTKKRRVDDSSSSVHSSKKSLNHGSKSSKKRKLVKSESRGKDKNSKEKAGKIVKAGKESKDMYKVKKAKCLKRIRKNEEVLKSLKKLKNKYSKHIGEESEKGQKAKRHIFTIGDFIRKESAKDKTLESQYWKIASACLSSTKEDAFRTIYMKLSCS